MIRMLVRALVLLIAAAIGLLVAKAVVEDMVISWASFALVVGMFTVFQSVLAPFIAKVAARNAPALLGGVGLLSTFVALLLTSVLTDGLTISGVVAWVLSSLIVWLVTMLATFLLPVILVKAGLSHAAERRKQN